jgi:hypothetical protein
VCGVLPGAVYNLLGSEEGEKNESGSEFLCILKVPSTGEWGQEHRSQQEGDNSTNGSTSTGTSTGCPKDWSVRSLRVAVPVVAVICIPM